MLSIDKIRWPSPAPVHEEARKSAGNRLNELTKPQGSLGLFEPIIEQISALQGTTIPNLSSPHLLIFAADHGVAKNHSVSRYDSHVTEEMCVNIAMGSSVVAVLARNYCIPLRLVDVGVRSAVRHPSVVVRKVAYGTRDFTIEPAMDIQEFEQALQTGMDEANQVIDNGCDCLILGEMGIGNTTSATAIAAWLLDEPVDQVVGSGTGIDELRKQEKGELIKRVLVAFDRVQEAQCSGQSDAIARGTAADLIHGFAYLGGFELVAMAGAMLAAASRNIPMVLDGLLAGVSALWTSRLEPGIGAYFLAGHVSAEPAHAKVLDALRLTPILSAGMRVGEGTGAVLAWPLLQGMLQVMAETATFSDARVTNPHFGSGNAAATMLDHDEVRSDKPQRIQSNFIPVSSDFTTEERDAVYKAIFARRDIRVFLPNKIDANIISRILTAAHHGPSVGYMQPWNFVVISDKTVLQQLQTVVDKERVRAGDKYPDDKRDYYLRLKVEGLVEAPLTICVTNDGTRGGPNVLGRNTIPETDLMSTSCAIENMWLAARAEGVAMGWVSIYEKADVRRVLGIPEHVDPSALLTLGYTPHFPDIPVLERVGWGKRLQLDNVIFDNHWGQKREGNHTHENLHTRR